MRKRFIIMLTNQSTGEAQPVFLLRDEFITADDAPVLSPRTCEPGPGTLTFVQNDGQMSIANSLLTIPAQSTPNWADLGFYSGALTRSAGLLLTQLLNGGKSNVGYVCHLKASGAVGYGDTGIGFYSDSTQYRPVETNGTVDMHTGATSLYMPNEYNLLSVIARNAGAYWLMNEYLIWVGEGNNTATLYAVNTNNDRAYSSDFIRAAQMGAPFVEDRGLATYYDATPMANDTAASESNALHYFDWTAATDEVFELMYRRVDDDNTMILRCAQAGTVKIISKVAGVETEKATANQTFTNGVSYRLCLSYDRKYHNVFVDKTRKITSGVANWSTINLYETGCKVSGFATGADWEIYPVKLSGAALAEWQKYTNPYLGGYQTQAVIDVPDGGDIAAACASMRRGDIISLAANGTYNLSAGATGFVGFKSGWSNTYKSEIRGNGATINGGNYGANLQSLIYFKLSDLNFRQQRYYCILVNDCDDFILDNCTFKSTLGIELYDVTHFNVCRHGTISNCDVLDSVGQASMDGFEVYGDSLDLTFSDCTSTGVAHGYEVWSGPSPAGKNKDITFLRCSSTSNTRGFSIEGGDQTLAQINCVCQDCTVSGNGIDYYGDEGATCYRRNSPGTTGGLVVDL